jgi:hypothetical protein
MDARICLKRRRAIWMERHHDDEVGDAGAVVGDGHLLLDWLRPDHDLPLQRIDIHVEGRAAGTAVVGHGLVDLGAPVAAAPGADHERS